MYICVYIYILYNILKKNLSNLKYMWYDTYFLRNLRIVNQTKFNLKSKPHNREKSLELNNC